MPFPSDTLLLYEVQARLARYRSQASDDARVAAASPPRRAPRVRAVLAAGLTRFAALLAAVAEDLDPAGARRRWEPRT